MAFARNSENFFEKAVGPGCRMESERLGPPASDGSPKSRTRPGHAVYAAKKPPRDVEQQESAS